MIRKLINYLRSCFCQHDWEVLEKVTVLPTDNMGRVTGDVPIKYIVYYRCKKCGYVQKIKMHP